MFIKEQLYMMALVPPPDLVQRIELIRNKFAYAFSCKAALKPPIHITLYPPFKEESEEEAGYIEQLKQTVLKHTSFGITLDGFGAFEGNGVIFINVDKNESLKRIHRSVTTQVNRLRDEQVPSRSQPYHPHITIGYRDIPPELFTEAVKDYLPQKFDAHFQVEHISLWKHDGRRWQTLANLPLQKESRNLQSSLF